LWGGGRDRASRYELKGTLGRDYSYAHEATENQCVATVTAAWTEGDTMFTAHVLEPGIPEKPGRGVVPKPRRPDWLKELIEFPEESSFKALKNELLQKYLDSDNVKRALEFLFEDVGPGAGVTGKPHVFARHLFPTFAEYYRVHAPAQIRDLAPLPNTLALEIVANAWNSDGLNTLSETTTLAMLTPETFSLFLSHCLQFASIIRKRLEEASEPPKKTEDEFAAGALV